MRGNKITGMASVDSPFLAEPGSGFVISGSDTGVSEKAHFVGRCMALVLHSTVLSALGPVIGGPWPFLVSTGAVIILGLYGALPPLPVEYLLPGLGGVITVAGIGAPLLRLLNPEGIEQDFWKSAPVRVALTQGADPPLHPNDPLVGIWAQMIGGIVKLREHITNRAIRAGRQAMGLALLSFLVAPWLRTSSPLPHWLLLTVPASLAWESLIPLDTLAVWRRVGQTD